MPTEAFTERMCWGAVEQVAQEVLNHGGRHGGTNLATVKRNKFVPNVDVAFDSDENQRHARAAAI